jgi:hypothetical protein
MDGTSGYGLSIATDLRNWSKSQSSWSAAPGDCYNTDGLGGGGYQNLVYLILPLSSMIFLAINLQPPFSAGIFQLKPCLMTPLRDVAGIYDCQSFLTIYPSSHRSWAKAGRFRTLTCSFQVFQERYLCGMLGSPRASSMMACSVLRIIYLGFEFQQLLYQNYCGWTLSFGCHTGFQTDSRWIKTVQNLFMWWKPDLFTIPKSSPFLCVVCLPSSSHCRFIGLPTLHHFLGRCTS